MPNSYNDNKYLQRNTGGRNALDDYMHDREYWISQGGNPRLSLGDMISTLYPGMSIQDAMYGQALSGGVSWKVASALNRRAQVLGTSTATQKSIWFRYKIVIGSDDFSSLKLSFPASYLPFTGGDTGVGNDYTIVSCAFEKETGGAAHTPVTFTGSRTSLVTNGATEFLSDAINPSSFGLGSFARGSVFWVRGLLSVPSTSMKIPLTNKGVSNIGGVTIWHNPVTTGVSAVDGTGAPSYGVGTGGSGPTDFAFTTLFAPVVIGTPVGSSGKFFSGIGDSIVFGTGDTSPAVNLFAQGFFQRSMFDADFVSNVRAGICFGFAGANADMWTGGATAASKKLMSYTNVTVEEFGTNGAQLANSQAIWAYAKSIGHQVVRTKLLTITTSSDVWATTGNQTKVAAWTTPSGDRITFNTAVAALEGSGYDKFVSFDSTVLHSDRDIWKAPGFTSDGTHPTTATHELMAVAMRTAYSTL